MRYSLLALCLAAATATAAPKKPTAPASADTLLRAPDAFLALSLEGFIAAVPSGEHVVLVKARAKVRLDASYDPALELVWLWEGDTLEVFDVRTPAAKPVAIAVHVPNDIFTVENGPGGSFSSADTHAPGGVVLDWAAATIRVEASGFLGDDERKQPPGMKVVGAKWLAAQATRQPAVVPEATHFARTGSHPLPKGATCKHDELGHDELCGAPAPFGATGWTLHITSSHCEYVCEYLCVAAKGDQLANVPALTPYKADDPNLCGPYKFDADGKLWIDMLGHDMCSATGCTTPLAKPGAPDLSFRMLGWRHPGTTVTPY